jgi:hypothetical protein
MLGSFTVLTVCPILFSNYIKRCKICRTYTLSLLAEGNMRVEHRWHGSDWGQPSTHRKTIPNATSSTKNPIWSALGLNPGLQGDRLALTA